MLGWLPRPGDSPAGWRQRTAQSRQEGEGAPSGLHQPGACYITGVDGSQGLEVCGGGRIHRCVDGIPLVTIAWPASIPSVAAQTPPHLDDTGH